MEITLALIAVVLSLILAKVSFVAYKKSHLRPALYLLMAFLLLAVKKGVELLQLTERVERDVGLAIGGLEAVFLILLVLALWRR
ncbi:MAG: hypothetical protein J7L37_09130 [Thermococcus sp.]|nr:hypothetical protein [Thermococcus sp.]